MSSSVRVTTLDNGLKVVTDEMPHVETVSVGVWVGVGARNEVPAVNGVAHMLEHMVFKGTERRSARQIAEEVEAVGGQMNAYTGRENTAFYVKVLKQDVGLGVDVISDILQNSVFDPEEYERERTVVLAEIGQAQDTPDDIVFDHFQLAAYPDQAIGRPVLGTNESIGALGRDEVAGYLHRHYAGGNMVLSAAGNIEHDRLVDLARDAFAGSKAEVEPMVEAARYEGSELRDERDLEQTHIVLGFDGLSYHDPDFYGLSLLSTAMGGGMSSRLFQEVREKRGLVYSIYSFSASYEDGGLFGIYAGTNPEDVGELIPVVCDEMLKAAGGITDEEMERARAQMRAGLLMGMESTMARCEQSAHQLLSYGRVVPVEELVAHIEAVDRPMLQRVAQRLLAKRPTLSAVGPLAGLESYDNIRQRLAA
jgi:predicted Zn-dependent peptidase